MNFFHLEKAKRATQGRNDLRKSVFIRAHPWAIEDYYERQHPEAQHQRSACVIS